MYVSSSTYIYFIILLLSLLLLHTGVQGDDPAIQQCSDTAKYTSNSQFETNLNLLLSSLLSNGTRDGFFNTSIGTGPDTVYGLVSCRGDLLTHPRCRNCLHNSTVDVIRICPKRKQALLWYWDCILRYSNDSQAFTQVDLTFQGLYNVGKVSDPDHFYRQYSSLLNILLNNAASIPNRYDFGKIDYKPSQPIEGLAQCIRDLSNTDCYTCLRNMTRYIQDCCASNQGGHFYTTSCFLKFEIYPFLQVKPKTIFPPFDDSPPQSNALPSPPPQSNVVPSPGAGTSPTLSKKGTGKGKSTQVFTIVVPLIGSLLLLAISVCLTYWLLRRNKRKKIPEINYKDDMEEMRSAESLEYNFREVRDATENFSDANKLGKGGFGIVYKGLLSDGRQIAVKRLSSNSGQGVVEFKNEVLLVVKLQHRNLVKLLGFCLEGDEKLLIYEFAENKSLDHYIFDPLKHTYLDWETRYKIIGGIARGLLYLHVDSRLRIIHRDLKAANILLDGQMEPKISDFGMARLFGVDQTDGSTGRIVGTYGYMAPEYAMHGQFSVKSDVFSFGVLILEIISGQKNTSFFQSEHVDNLNSYAWRHWENGTTSELIDPTLKEHYSNSEIIRCINIGLLCVQEDVTKRPTMATVVHMLNTESVTVPLPSTPAFFVNSVQSISRSTEDSINEISMTGFYPR